MLFKLLKVEIIRSVTIPPIANEEKKTIDLRNFKTLSIGDNHCQSMNTTREKEGKTKTDIFKEIYESQRKGKKFIYQSPKINNSRSTSAKQTRPFFQSTLIPTQRIKETNEKQSWYDELKEKRQLSKTRPMDQVQQVVTKYINLYDTSILQESFRTPQIFQNKEIIIKNPFAIQSQTISKSSQFLQAQCIQSQAMKSKSVSNKKIFQKQSFSPLVYSTDQKSYLQAFQ